MGRLFLKKDWPKNWELIERYFCKVDIFYTPTAEKNLLRLAKKERIRVIGNIRRIAAEPQSGKKLKGRLSGLWSKRSWPYRIIYQFSGKKLIVVAVGHRKSVYR